MTRYKKNFDLKEQEMKKIFLSADRSVVELFKLNGKQVRSVNVKEKSVFSQKMFMRQLGMTGKMELRQYNKSILWHKVD